MKGFTVDSYRPDALQLTDVPVPSVGARDVLVEVRAAGTNPLDKMVRNGEFKQLLKYKPPFVLGHDVAGVVTHVGAEVRDLKVGVEVYSRPRDLRIGTFAELGVRYSVIFMRASGAQLKTLAALQDDGILRPVLDRTFNFDQTLEAMTYVEQGKANGKIVITP